MSSLKPNLIRDNLGNIYYRKMINGRMVINPSYTKNHKHANKLHTTLEYQALMEHYAPKDKKKFKRFSELVKLYLSDKEVLARWTEDTRQVTQYVLNAYIKNRKLPNNKETAKVIK